MVWQEFLSLTPLSHPTTTPVHPPSAGDLDQSSFRDPKPHSLDPPPHRDAHNQLPHWVRPNLSIPKPLLSTTEGTRSLIVWEQATLIYSSEKCIQWDKDRFFKKLSIGCLKSNIVLKNNHNTIVRWRQLVECNWNLNASNFKYTIFRLCFVYWCSYNSW